MTRVRSFRLPSWLTQRQVLAFTAVPMHCLMSREDWLDMIEDWSRYN